jgi:hypothetical protein
MRLCATVNKPHLCRDGIAKSGWIRLISWRADARQIILIAVLHNDSENTGMSRSPLQFSLSRLLAITGVAACFCGLCFWVGIGFALPCVAIPFALYSERLFASDGAGDAVHNRRPPIRVIVVLACALSVGAISLQAIADGFPTIRSPLPMLLALPELVLSGLFGMPPEVTAIFPVVMFSVFAIPAIGQERTGIRPIFPILLAVASVLDICFLVAGVQLGVRYEGEQYTFWVTVANLVSIAVLWLMWGRWRRTAGFGQRIAILTAMHCWLFWCAFPWLGELI